MLATTLERTALRSLAAARTIVSTRSSFCHAADVSSTRRNNSSNDTPPLFVQQQNPLVRLLSSTSSFPSGSNAAAPQPLILWVVTDDDGEDLDSSEEEDEDSVSSSSSSESSSDDDSEYDDDAHSLVLMPPNLTNTTFVESAEGVVEAVNRHYSSSQFVGGTGKEDPGVWFAPFSETVDVLANAQTLELMETSMARSREERAHGVPFHVYTSGVNVDAAAVAALKWDSVQVSLWAATPTDYAKCTGGRNSDEFAAVCGFIAEASDLGVPVEVGVLKPYANRARDLASSLGARQVHVYEEEDDPW